MHLNSYMMFRSNVAFKFGFQIDPKKPRIFVSAAKKDGVQGSVDKDTYITFALSLEECGELIHATKTRSEIKLVHDASKSSYNDDTAMKSLNGGEYKGRYYWSLNAGNEKRVISPSPGELAVLEELFRYVVVRSFSQNLQQRGD